MKQIPYLPFLNPTPHGMKKPTKIQIITDTFFSSSFDNTSRFSCQPPNSSDFQRTFLFGTAFYLSNYLLVSRLFAGRCVTSRRVIDHHTALTNCGLWNIASAIDGDFCRNTASHVCKA
ncbi:hypothetical protein CDAR_484051 [Caerostris darwini]|uniref:Uncharacterized protein n=1 Tax=Caerostris darwini TaxID=1538125 RepID=A0AAV4T5G7_9ARAC|nr:hypothetical protein CDAR_484051 [Caerostris darwini]